MPQTIGNHGLYCPEFDDYAAVALYMQDLGTRIDDALTAQSDALNSFVNSPAMLLTNSVARTLPVALPIDSLIFDTILYLNNTFMSFEPNVGGENVIYIGSPAGAPTTIPYLRGAYSYGVAVRMSAVGPVTLGSVRQVSAFATDEIAAPFQAFSACGDQAIDMNVGSDIGIEGQTNMLLAGTSGVTIKPFATHDNVASDVTIFAGDARFWVFYNGANDIVEVA